MRGRHVGPGEDPSTAPRSGSAQDDRKRRERALCDGCRYLSFTVPVNRYDVFTANCCDPDKPALGARRVVAVSPVGQPRRIERPKWCKRA